MADDDDLVQWNRQGFTDDEAHKWLSVILRGRFTPHTAREWADAGFGPADAAQWSERYTNPLVARMMRQDVTADPSEWPRPGGE